MAPKSVHREPVLRRPAYASTTNCRDPASPKVESAGSVRPVIAKHRRRSAQRMLSEAHRRPAGKVPVDGGNMQSEAVDDRHERLEPEAPAQAIGARREQRQGDWRKHGRLAFSSAEDDAMRRYVAAHPHLKSKGEQIWKNAEAAGITGHGWASMQNRWRRQLARRSQGARGNSRLPGRQKEPPRQADLRSLLDRRDETMCNAPVPEPKAQIAPQVIEDDFDGQWSCGAQTHVVRGNDVILDSSLGSVGGEICELQRLEAKACKFVFDSIGSNGDDNNSRVHSYNSLKGHLSGDGQQIVWEDGCTWNRKSSLLRRTRLHGCAYERKSPTLIIDSRLPEFKTTPSLAELFKRQKAAVRSGGNLIPQRDATRSPRRHGESSGCLRMREPPESETNLHMDKNEASRVPRSTSMESSSLFRRRVAPVLSSGSASERNRHMRETGVYKGIWLEGRLVLSDREAQLRPQGLKPSKISEADDAWKEEKWDEIAEAVGKHFDEPRVHAHWKHLAERLKEQG
mmetsp:Transcript_109386/g.172417  ORF Transcript_109386/g.172417 Transcript_109386/m.172417 type:complete len:512 (-) Transcript_109386:195-1730(-)